MGWIEDITERWLRALRASSGDEWSGLGKSKGLVWEACDQVADLPRRRLWRRRKPSPEAILATVLARHVVVGMVLADHLLSTLATASERSRAELLAEIPIEQARWAAATKIRALDAEAAADFAILTAREPEKPWHALAERTERLLHLAEQAAADISAAAPGNPRRTGG